MFAVMTPRIFITAFEPYDHWTDNSSWLALVELTRTMSRDAYIVTRRYPVDFDEVRERLDQDLSQGFDYALHLGQAPGSSRIQLEAVGLNVGGNSRAPSEQRITLVEDGPVAYRSQLPLDSWIPELRKAGIPAAVSYHAGTYLCNATLYLTHHFIEQKGLSTQATFIHLPLDVSQVSQIDADLASMPSSISAHAVRLIVETLVRRARQPDRELA